MDPARLRRPDVFIQPLVQRQVVGQPAQQRHGGMRMGIDQPRHEQVAVELVVDPGAMRSRGFEVFQSRM